MGKVRMKDVLSKSENVKLVFRKAMKLRTKSFLEKIKFTEDELIEIIDISENVEYHSDRRGFYRRLIESQTGPFTDRVFGAFIDKLFHSNSLKHLLIHSVNISQYHKLSWLNHMMTASLWRTISFVRKNRNNFGLDIDKSPYNLRYVKLLFEHSTSNLHNRSFDGESIAELQLILETLTEKEQMEWYDFASLSNEDQRIGLILLRCPEISSKILERHWAKSDDLMKKELALHPNIPLDLRMQMYEETKNDDYLPQSAKDTFIF